MQNFKMLTNLLLGERAKKKKERKRNDTINKSQFVGLAVACTLLRPIQGAMYP